jgi:hypothetical protein
MNATETIISASTRYTFHVLVSSASMPNNCKGTYKRVAVLRVDHHEREVGYTPKTIREIRGVEIVRTWERLHVGKTDACAYRVAIAEAETYAAECRREAAEEAKAA